jgi:uncharacterized protein (DUF1499 family)
MPAMIRLWWAPAAIVLTGLAAGALLAGRVVSPLVGFAIFGLSGAVGLVFGAGLAGVGLYRLARGRDGARRALATAVIPLLAGLAVVGSLLSTPAALYNDVTTDLADPPVFVAGPAAGAPYPDDFRAWHRETYPYLAPVRLPTPRDATLARVRALVLANGWTITAEDRDKGLIQALARTAVFGFEDDVLIRVRSDAAGSLVDMRSRSRVGRGDRGVNARRIRDTLLALMSRG